MGKARNQKLKVIDEETAIMEVKRELEAELPFQFNLTDMRKFGEYYLDECIKNRRLGDYWLIRSSLVSFIKKEHPEIDLSVIFDYFSPIPYRK